MVQRKISKEKCLDTFLVVQMMFRGGLPEAIVVSPLPKFLLKKVTLLLLSQEQACFVPASKFFSNAEK